MRPVPSDPRPRPLPLFDLSHAETRDLCARGVPIYLPVNPVEYHGPHLSLRNDYLCGMGLAADLHARLAPADGAPWPFLVASPIEAGVEPCPGPGTRAVPFLAVRRLVVDACRALADLGARRIVLVTFHGAPLHAHALDAGVRYSAARGVRAIQPHNLLMRELMRVDGSAFAEGFAHVEDAEERAAMMRDMALDFHAGFGETSVALHYAPESVGPVYKTLPPCPPIVPDPPFVAAARAARVAGRAELAVEPGSRHAGAAGRTCAPSPATRAARTTPRPRRARTSRGASWTCTSRPRAPSSRVRRARARSCRGW